MPKSIYPPFTVIQGGKGVEEEQLNKKPAINETHDQNNNNHTILIALKGTDIVGAFTDYNLAISYAANNINVKLISIPENSALQLK